MSAYVEKMEKCQEITQSDPVRCLELLEDAKKYALNEIDYASVHRMKARCYLNLNQVSKAEKEISKALELYPQGCLILCQAIEVEFYKKEPDVKQMQNWLVQAKKTAGTPEDFSRTCSAQVCINIL